MDYQQLDYAVDDGVALVTLNRPDRLNAMTLQMGGEIRAAMQRASDDDAVRAIVLTGAGRGFCAGADAARLQGTAAGGTRETEPLPNAGAIDGGLALPRGYAAKYAYLSTVPKPLIAAVNGAAVGVGLVLALYCDVRFAADGARLGPALIAFGTPAQQAHYLPRILNGEDWWCQGYSEPEAGSDLASLRTRAEADGDDYIVNGAKIWTSAAEEATHIFALVRTDAEAKPQSGISFLLIDMTSPGIRVEPLIALNGRHLWNQVFFDDVRVPQANRLGAENQGWTVAKKLLGDERFFVSRVSENRRMLALVREVAGEERAGSGRLIDDPDFALRLADLARRLDALEVLSLRLLSDADAGRPVGAEPSMTKLLGSHLVQDMDEALLACVGAYAMPDHGEFLFRGGNQLPVGPDHAIAATANYLHHRGFTIAGGTSEVQRNTLAKQTLGL